MTVGYGDITPQNSSEILFAAITIVFGCGVYAYNLNAVGILLSELKREENKYNANLRNINKFMDKKRIDTELQVFSIIFMLNLCKLIDKNKRISSFYLVRKLKSL
jgi:hypothetical protein